MEDNEIPLCGGNVNSNVVRVGNTVRRELSAASRSIHRLLEALDKDGFSHAPKFLGIDEKNREILSYITGRCTLEPEYWIDTRYLISAGQILKAFHDASAAFLRSQDIEADDNLWAYQYPDKSMHEVICHNDFAPYNLIAEANQFVAVIDFDLAGPGPRIRDVAYAAYWLVPLSQCAHDMKAAAIADVLDGSKRLKQFCAICGVPADQAMLYMVSEVLWQMSNEQKTAAIVGSEVAAKLKADGHLEHWTHEATAFEAYRSAIEKNL